MYSTGVQHRCTVPMYSTDDDVPGRRFLVTCVLAFSVQRDARYYGGTDIGFGVGLDVGFRPYINCFASIVAQRWLA